MKLSQSNIGVKLSEIVGGDGNVSLKFTFPDFITGRFELIITRESDNVLFDNRSTAGNCTFVEDIWRGAGYCNISYGLHFPQLVR